METMKDLVSEWWAHVLLMYRTMVIKAELKRRKAIAGVQDQNNKSCKKTVLLNDQNQIFCDKESHSMIIQDFSCSGTPSKMYKCNTSEMRRVFDLFDENKDGLISEDDLQLFMKRLGSELSEQKVRDMVRTIDRNRDGSIDFQEFFALYNSLCGEGEEEHTTGEYCDGQHCPTVREDADEEENLLKAFFIFDENKDGLISALELQQVLVKLGLPEARSLMSCQKMIEKVDTDGNGKVDFFEFKDMMSSNAFNFCGSQIGVSAQA